jgi:hypothetical protein
MIMNPQNSPTSSTPAGGIGVGGSSSNATSGALQDTKNKIKDTAREAASKVKAAASDTATRAKDEAGRIVSEKRDEAANRIGNYSSAIHESARSLEQEDPNIAWFTHRAADKIQGVADYMRSRDFSGLRSDVEGMARRHPAAFFGGMFLAGLILGNVVKASRRKADSTGDDDESTGYDSGWAQSSDSMALGQSEQPADLSATERSAAGI